MNPLRACESVNPLSCGSCTQSRDHRSGAALGGARAEGKPDVLVAILLPIRKLLRKLSRPHRRPVHNVPHVASGRAGLDRRTSAARAQSTEHSAGPLGRRTADGPRGPLALLLTSTSRGYTSALRPAASARPRKTLGSTIVRTSGRGVGDADDDVRSVSSVMYLGLALDRMMWNSAPLRHTGHRTAWRTSSALASLHCCAQSTQIL